MKTDQTVEKIYCPTCGSRGDIHKIVYGFPAPGFDSETYEMGGCTIFFDEPNWMCRTCGWEGVNKPRRKTPSIRTKAGGIGKFYATRADAALKRDRAAGYHWGYLSGEGKVICTCGLVVNSNDKAGSKEVVRTKFDSKFEYEFEPVAYVRGHRNLPSCRGAATALIVEHWYEDRGRNQDASAYCQGCGDVSMRVELTEAKGFVTEHNESCGH